MLLVKMNWLEVSLTVNDELAEAVADVLARFAPQGVVLESREIGFTSDEDEGTPSGCMVVRAYLPMDEHIEKTRQKLEEALYFLGRIRPLPAPTFTSIADQDWMETWKQNYKPIPIGRRLLVLPAWSDSPEPQRIPIRIDPGMAFGTGTHPTTQLCLVLIEQAFDDQAAGGRRLALRRPPSALIDVGCGSGILSIAALKLGATVALGVDLDAQAIENARHNAQINGLGREMILEVGSVKDILEGRFALASAPLVVVNILAPVIIRLLDEGLAKLVEPGGSLILSGILLEQERSVAEAAQSRGLKTGERRQRGDWVALTYHL